jgi:hypothetical protein
VSADPTHASSSYCGPEPFIHQSWQLNSTLNVIDTSLIAPALAVQRRQYTAPPGDSCTQCCCCVTANPGTRNFCASNSGGDWQTTVPNCDYMGLHPDIVLSNFGGGGSFQDTYTIQGTLLIWLTMDPVYGCFKDLATVTLASSTPTQSIPSSATSTTAPVTPTTPTQCKWLSD